MMSPPWCPGAARGRRSAPVTSARRATQVRVAWWPGEANPGEPLCGHPRSILVVTSMLPVSGRQYRITAALKRPGECTPGELPPLLDPCKDPAAGSLGAMCVSFNPWTCNLRIQRWPAYPIRVFKERGRTATLGSTYQLCARHRARHPLNA